MATRLFYSAFASIIRDSSQGVKRLIKYKKGYKNKNLAKEIMWHFSTIDFSLMNWFCTMLYDMFCTAGTSANEWLNYNYDALVNFHCWHPTISTSNIKQNVNRLHLIIVVNQIIIRSWNVLNSIPKLSYFENQHLNLNQLIPTKDYCL